MGGYSSGAGGFASGFQGAFGTTLNTAMAMKRQQLQEQSNKIAQYGELGKLKDLWEKNPDVARPITKDFLQKMEIDPDTQKTWLDSLEKSGNDFRSQAMDAAIKLGLKPDGPTLKQLMSAGPSGLFQMGNDMAKLDANNKVDAALNGPQDAGTAAPAAPAAPPTLNSAMAAGTPSPDAPTPAPTPGPAPTPTPAPAPGPDPQPDPSAADNSRTLTSIGNAAKVSAPVPAMQNVTLPDQQPIADQSAPQAPVVPPASPPMPPAMQSAVGAPHPAAMPGMPPGAATPDAAHSVADRPAYDAATAYKRYMNAANTLEARNPDRAKDLRDQAANIAKSANVTMNGNDPRVKGLGFKPGAIVQWNAATNEAKVVQEGQNSWTMLDPKDPKYANLYANQTPGTLIGREDQTGNIGVKVTGANMFKPATPEQLKSFNVGPGSVPPGTSIGVDATGKPITQQLVPEQEIPVSAARRQQLGTNLDPNQAYTENLTTGKISAIQTGQTAEKENVRLSAVADQKELDAQRESLSKNSSVLANNAIIRNLVSKFGTGPIGDMKLYAGQLADQFNVKMPKGLEINTSAGEALRATLGNKVVDQAMGLSGQKSYKELQMVKQNVGNLLLTGQGNNLITNISDWSAQKGNEIANLANNWEGQLSNKASTGPYQGMNYYQAKASLQNNQALPPELRDELDKQVGDIKSARTILPKINSASEDELRLLSRYGGIMTKMEQKRAAARWDELGLK